MDEINFLRGIFLFICLNCMAIKCDQPGYAAGSRNTQSGVRLRLTEAGMKRATEIGFSIVRNQLINKHIKAAGERGSVTYSVDSKITKFDFGNVQVTPIDNVGMRGLFSNIAVGGGGTVHYRYKKGWFKISDTVEMTFDVSRVNIKFMLGFNVNQQRQPTIDVVKCSTDIGDVNLHFHGSKGWIYNLFKGLLEKKVRNALEGVLCKSVKNWSSKATIPVIEKLDRWALLDYGLTSRPQFTSTYMDVCFKGEFQCVDNPKESNLTVPHIEISTDDKKMVYFWVTDYTINTAGQVYHASKKLAVKVNSWDKKAPEELKEKLNTKAFGLFIPELQKRYPDLPMSVKLESSKPPHVVMVKGALSLFLNARTTFNVKKKNGNETEVFSIQFDIITSLSAAISENRIVGKINDFKYKSKVINSDVGDIISLDEIFIKMIIEKAVIEKANPLLAKGFPLPHIPRVQLVNLDLDIRKNAIRIGSDIQYTG